MLTPYLPYPLLSGGQIRTYNLLKKLSQHHSITLFALIKDESEKKYISHLEEFCSVVRVFKRSQRPFTLKNVLKTAVSSYPFLIIRNHVPEVIKAVEAELSYTQYDLIHAETFYMMPHIPQTDTPILLVEQTIEYLGYESYAERAHPLLQPILAVDIAKIKHWEKHFWKKSDVLVTMSEADKEYIAQVLGEKEGIQVVENGVDAAWFAEKPWKPPPTPTALFVGTFKWLPNVEAVNYLLDAVWNGVKAQIPNAQLHIVGNEPTQDIIEKAKALKDVKVLGRIDDIRDAFSTANVLIAPVMSGKGTRYKILEAMAAGTPIVATPTAVEGIDVTPDTHVVLSSSPEELIQQTVKVLQNRSLQKKLSSTGKLYVAQHFEWGEISKKLDALYNAMGNQS
ncbi:MAG: glycosyltransferase [Pseudomonadales bacterium]|nr:glycosyltransferase [Candidatus Woesebacteria bacterium]MCB9802164.1 glycosyltransferase [Pseudomonadales bacterium]